MDKAPVRPARPASLAHDTRGATMQEYLVMTAVVALASATTWAAFGRDAASVLVGDSAADSLAAHPPAFSRPTVAEPPRPSGVICTGGVCTRPGQCFAPGTLVETEAGLAPIESLEVGDHVLTLDEESGGLVARAITHVFRTPDQPVMALELVDDDTSEVLVLTGEHPLRARDGWRAARDLAPGDEVLSAHSGWLRVGAGTWLQAHSTVFNLEIEGAHTYLVGDDGVWAHNQCNAGPPRPLDPALRTASHGRRDTNGNRVAVCRHDRGGPGDWSDPTAQVVDELQARGARRDAAGNPVPRSIADNTVAVAHLDDGRVYVSTSRGVPLTPEQEALLDAHYGEGRWTYVGGTGHAEENLVDALPADTRATLAAGHQVCLECQEHLARRPSLRVSSPRRADGALCSLDM